MIFDLAGRLGCNGCLNILLRADAGLSRAIKYERSQGSVHMRTAGRVPVPVCVSDAGIVDGPVVIFDWPMVRVAE